MILCLYGLGYAQSPQFDKKSFFTDERPAELNIVSGFSKLARYDYKNNKKHHLIPAVISGIFPGHVIVNDSIEISARGEFRKEECFPPPLLVNFKKARDPVLKKLGHLKLVWPCGSTAYDEQLVLKEFLVYRIYNLFTEKSFRVRLLKMGYPARRQGTEMKKSYAFFIEDVDEMARRNECREVQKINYHSETTNRTQATLFSLFQYMIGNHDWAVSLYRNVKLIQKKDDSLSLPFLVPYDFDYCGLVNAGYAVPNPDLGISTVLERVYRGFPRTMEELQTTLQKFRMLRPAIDSLIMNFEPLRLNHKKEMISYLEEFFNMAENEKDIKKIFIINARNE